jgi:hypothetical protein
MAYGERRGFRNPGEYRAGDVMTLAASSGAGLTAALATDYVQKGQTSALFKISEWTVSAGRLAGLGDLPLWIVALTLIGVGALSVLYFQPLTRLGAFARGFGLIAALMAATPMELASGLPSSIKYGRGLAPAVYAGVAPANPEFAGAAGEAAVFAVQDVTPDARFNVALRIVFPGAPPADFAEQARTGRIRGRLHNEATKETFDLFRGDGDIAVAGDSISIAAGVPTNTAKANLWVRVEVEGYAIEIQSAEASLARPLEWTIAMRESKIPLAIQRLGKSYWF